MMFRVFNKTLNKTPKKKEEGKKRTLTLFSFLDAKTTHASWGNELYIITEEALTYLPRSRSFVRSFVFKQNRPLLLKERERERVLRLWRRRRRRRRRTPDDENGFDDSFRRD